MRLQSPLFRVHLRERGHTGLDQSQTAPERGLGLKIIRQIVERYGNLLDTEHGDDYYRVTVPLSLR